MKQLKRVAAFVLTVCLALSCLAALADTYDYYAVPSFFIGKEKLFEAHIGMRYEDIKAAVQRCLDAALA